MFVSVTFEGQNVMGQSVVLSMGLHTFLKVYKDC